MRYFVVVVFAVLSLSLAAAPPRGTPSTGNQTLVGKAATIKIKRIELEEVPLDSVFHMLRLVIKKDDPEKRGINIVTMGLDKIDKSITLTLSDISALDAIRAICASAGLQYKFERYAVVIQPKPPKKKK